MITRTHITAACLALAALSTGCLTESENTKSQAPAHHSETTSAAPSKPAPAAKPMDSGAVAAPASAAKPSDPKPSDKPAARETPPPKPDPKNDKAQSAKIGEAAPAFMLKDIDGKEHSLAQYKGKTVVLEWFNPNCPVCQACYTDGSLKGMPERYMADGVVWLGINSGSAESKSNGELNRPFVEKHKLKAPILVDSSGTVGMSYSAKTTPHMYVIDPKGVLVYAGAIDNQKKGDECINYVDAAMADLKAGKPVKTATTKPYGCNVKYAKPQ